MIIFLLKSMKKLFLIITIICLYSCSLNDSKLNIKQEITTILNTQAKAWSNNNIEEFMQGYWKNDSLKFYGANGVTNGWQNTLNNYKQRYPSKDHTGKLNFKIHSISKITDNAYYVMGEYFLKRSIGDTNGIFMIIFKKINGEWKIISDTSC